MPRFFFDLFYDRYVVLDPGGMPFERKAAAKLAAREMARHLATVRPELRNGRGWIRVRDCRRNELCRLAIGSRPEQTGEKAGLVQLAAE